MEEKSLIKESHSRFSEAVREAGWCEFMTLSSLFDQDSGFLVQDTVVFSAEVHLLKEQFIMEDLAQWKDGALHVDLDRKSGSFTWKVENFLSFKEVVTTGKLLSNFFQVGGCKLQIGVGVSSDIIRAFLECDPSVVSDLDKNFWVSYRMAIVNQKDTAKNLWKESSFCTRTCNDSAVPFMKLSDMLAADSGFLVRETVLFVCEILDCCRWFEFSDLEVLASDDAPDTLSTDVNDLTDSEGNDVVSDCMVDIFKGLLAEVASVVSSGDNSLQKLVTLKEKYKMDVGTITRILVRLRLELDDHVIIKHLLLQNKFTDNNDRKQEDTSANDSSLSLMNLMLDVNDLLLDVMVECCQPLSGRSDKVSCNACSMPSSYRNDAACQSESSWYRVPDSFQTLGSGVDESTSSYSGVISTDIPKGDMIEQPALKFDWPNPSKELLGIIVDSLKALKRTVPRGCQEPKQKPQSVKKISLVLDKAPSYLYTDLVTLLPKLVDHSEHPLAASALLDQLEKPDAEPALRTPVLDAISELDCGAEVWECLLFQASKLLVNANDEPLAATISFMFKAASQCQYIPQAVKLVCARLQSLGALVSPFVLNLLGKTVHNWVEVADEMLNQIEYVFELDERCLTTPSGPFIYCEEEPATKGLHLVDEKPLHVDCHFFDAYILVEMLTIPSLVVKASLAFERGVARGFIVEHSMAMVLERHKAQILSVDSTSHARKYQHKNIAGEGIIESPSDQEVDFTSLLGLAERLSLSENSQVLVFVRMFYATLFRLFADESYHRRMLKRLVDHATSPRDNCCDVDMDVLVFLVHEECEVVRPVLSTMREVVELANIDRSALWQQLCASKDENNLIREEMQDERSNLGKEKAVLLERLNESEAASNRFKSEMRNEMERFAGEKKALSEQIHEVESQIEWLCSERDDEIARLSSEKNVCQGRLHDLETQLSQLKSQRHDELQRVLKEKNSLAERLRNAETERKRFSEELRRYAREAMKREEERQSLLDEVRQLKLKIELIEGEKQEKDKQLIHCEVYINGMEAKLANCKQQIHSLKVSLEEEMLQHAPLYGVGLDTLSMKELETLSRIHEDGLKEIHALQHQKGSPGGNPFVIPSNLHHPVTVHPAAPPPSDGRLPTTRLNWWSDPR